VEVLYKAVERPVLAVSVEVGMVLQLVPLPVEPGPQTLVAVAVALNIPVEPLAMAAQESLLLGW
jgi:hypothetical protein